MSHTAEKWFCKRVRSLLPKTVTTCARAQMSLSLNLDITKQNSLTCCCYTCTPPSYPPIVHNDQLPAFATNTTITMTSYQAENRLTAAARRCDASLSLSASTH